VLACVSMSQFGLILQIVVVVCAFVAVLNVDSNSLFVSQSGTCQVKHAIFISL